ncbi:23S rRNA (cytidine1920-2'-O)/16S rRNA (cytidine1409-2'-O)-methyltransferase [Chromobacterium alkanivorans]|uniref:TlyA family RNA methyltransferase n=1 Tax=Chromobacterium alkanivorans TaxID=1071719 RepID=UPI00216A3EFF|nr:TlyA family RNA methyltransferase [Chromobacterium alkanivorans]MCS3805464.1 23S rRNA (cytidine1920-2'-O)/16S rRNA (cytidine1409-2'-O)-methyltransferase [Chromobacterium alkanivorans]MCS3819803.1 23S rRNA (cytidine1920-2'-O)/16S rRNA (cytidine1409-2'-O)-methyltransferase [Chromobacterium alkanivorans]MCS3874222.1 23S rRNA (cytidine1920-2'-O)/16S rRNA (cytidine1409-2'-O)-methyltransferase [Chromobacterium alkanivorans]
MTRVDVLLVELGLAASRTAAQNLIAAGRVSCDGAPVSKPSQKCAPGCRFDIAADPSDRFVSRGGLKMLGALESSGLDPRDALALDVGQSTGGFSDCLLQQGARRVVGVDVGHDQLHPRLRTDPRVRYFEGVNARALDHAALLAANDGLPFDLMVCDVSFISLTLVLPSALPLIRPGGHLLSLVKPQFEVGREGLARGGIVRDESLYPRVRDKISEAVREQGFELLKWFDSPITGGDGNREFFIYARKR